MVLDNKIIFGIIIVFLITFSIFLTYRGQKNRYNCTEDGCKMASFGQFNDKKSCENACTDNKVKSNDNLTSTIQQNNIEHPSTENNSDTGLHSTVDSGPGRSNVHSGPGRSNVHSGPGRSNVHSGPGRSTVDSGPGRSNVHNGPGRSNVHSGPGRKTDNSITTNMPTKEDKLNKNNLNTLYINYHNVKNIEEQIKNKKKSIPYFATTKEAKSVITDYDTFPYPRYFRGNPESSMPIIAEREAGWRPRHDDAYNANVELELVPDCVGYNSGALNHLYKEQIFGCYDDDGKLLSTFSCTANREGLPSGCYDNAPEHCSDVGGIVGVDKAFQCNDSNLLEEKRKLELSLQGVQEEAQRALYAGDNKKYDDLSRESRKLQESISNTIRLARENAVLFSCPGGSENCFDDSPRYCPINNVEIHKCSKTGATFKCDSKNDKNCKDDSALYCGTEIG